jgi:hypothetical protein
MADKPTSVVLTKADKDIILRLRHFLKKRYGPVTFTFIVREALRALYEKLGSERA